MEQKYVMKQTAVAAALLVGGVGLALATDPTDGLTAIDAAKTTILGIVAAGGLAMVLVKLAYVGWAVGTKFISRLSSKS